VVVIVLIVAGGIAMLIIGLIQGQLATVIFGAVVLVFVVWGLASGNGGGGDDDDIGEA
jgi:hypothetical protein